MYIKPNMHASNGVNVGVSNFVVATLESSSGRVMDMLPIFKIAPIREDTSDVFQTFTVIRKTQ